MLGKIGGEQTRERGEIYPEAGREEAEELVAIAIAQPMSQFKVGDRVVFLKAPDWLLKDLPADEQDQIRSFVGKAAEITDVDDFGYLWIGFGSQVDEGEDSHYVGHSFAVTADCLRSATDDDE